MSQAKGPQVFEFSGPNVCFVLRVHTVSNICFVLRVQTVSNVYFVLRVHTVCTSCPW